ncbi:MAG: alpha/beta hydrolase [Bacteroidales bacterium]|nr:alpha/beta hydrolase [Bacteroidales bacterium]
MTKAKTREFTHHTIEQNSDYEGKVVCTLIERKADKKSTKAFLYLHGFNDYFFQSHLADWANDAGMNFYALELRKYGRSLLPHQTPNDFREYHEYFEDIDRAIDFIRSDEKNEHLTFMGHSTGGLLAALYADEHKEEKKVDLLILNSPFFEFNVPAILKKTFLPLMTTLGKSFPGMPSPVGLDKGYGYSIHQSHHGIWDYELKWKPDAGFKIHASWIRAIHLAHLKVQQGLDIPCPVLLMYSGKSVAPGNYKQEMQEADAVLNVADIEKFGKNIGKKVEHIAFKGGLHDLLLSKKEVQKAVMEKMTTFITDHS